MGGRDAASLKKRFERDLRITRKRIRRSLQEPSQENVHDMRTAIRRLQAIYLLLPGRARKRGKVSGYLASVREFLKATNRVRDSDVIRAHALRHLHDETLPLLMASLDRERKRGTVLTKRLGTELLALRLPLLRKSDLTDEEVRERGGKLTLKLTRKVREDLRGVVKGKGAVEEMHRLRIDSKILRYVLEASGRADEAPGALRDLERLQDQLGHIHDCDVTCLYLEQHDPGNRMGTLAQRIRTEREQLYLRFSRGLGPSTRPLPHLRPLRQ